MSCSALGPEYYRRPSLDLLMTRPWVPHSSLRKQTPFGLPYTQENVLLSRAGGSLLHPCSLLSLSHTCLKKETTKCYYASWDPTLFSPAPPGVGRVTSIHGESIHFTSLALHPSPSPSESHEDAILGSPTPCRAQVSLWQPYFPGQLWGPSCGCPRHPTPTRACWQFTPHWTAG